MIRKFGTEFSILLDVDVALIGSCDEDVARVIAAMRSNNIKFSSGYDGIFGKIIL
jgi:PHP family Zn ribbon phosphoesterase